MEATFQQAQPAQAPPKPPRSWVRWPAVVLALVGWWLCLDLVRLGFGVPASNPWLQARCGTTSQTGETFDCQSVLASKWASVPREPEPGKIGMPVATFGMAYFAFVGLWYFLLGSPTRNRWGWHLLLTLIVGCGVLQSLEMMYVMGSVLHKWCAGCVAAHALNGALALLTIGAFPWRGDRVGAASHPGSRLALATLAAGFFLFLLHPAVMRILMTSTAARQVYQEYRKIVDDPQFVRWQHQRQPVRTELDIEDRTYAGDPDAPNTVVAFTDVQCTACMSAFEILDDLVEKYPRMLRVDCRHFPLDPTCNEGWPQSGHPTSCEAARAVEAARTVAGAAGFRKMRRLLHEHRHEAQAAPYAQWAGELGLDVAAFSDALVSEAVADHVRADIELGKQLGVDSVPVLFLNGRRLDHWGKIETWEVLLGLEHAAPTSAPTAP